MFTIELLPAQRGDALWITYGTTDAPRHVLIDAGPENTLKTLVPELERRIAALPGKADRVELLVVTHIDADHIQGVVSLLSDPRRVPLFRDVWFNGFAQHTERLGGVDAERLSASLLQHPDHWNVAFDGGPVRIADDGTAPTVTLRDGLKLTVLGPTADEMRALVPEWEKACRAAGIVPGEGTTVMKKSWRRSELLGGFEPDLLAQSRFSSDPSKPNSAGIALMAEYGGRRLLLLADAPAGPVLAALDRLEPRPHRFAAVKMSHHGSRRNTSLEFAQAVLSPKWLVSTDGAIFGHPDPEAIARVVVGRERAGEPGRPTFFFNYVTDRIADIVADAGDRYAVKLPRQRTDGTYAEGIRVTV